MSDEEDSDNPRQRIEPMPAHKMRMTDLPDNLVEKAIRCKYFPFLNFNHKFYSNR